MSPKTDSQVNPSPKNGHIDVSNELAEQFAKRIRISGEEWQVLWVILRQTWGWHEPWAKISLKDFNKKTGIVKPRISRLLQKLQDKKVITKKGNENPHNWHINSHYDQWKPLPKKVTGIKEWYGVSINKIKEQIRKRDENICQICGYNGNLTNERLNVHHINYNQTISDPENLITLCKSCHMRTNSNQKHWEHKLKEIITQKGNVTQKGTVTPTNQTEDKQTENLKENLTQKGTGLTQKGTGLTQKGTGLTQKGNNPPSNELSPRDLQTPKETIDKESTNKETINKETKHSGQKPAHKKESKKVLQTHQFLVEQFKKLYEQKYRTTYVDTEKDFVISARLLKKVNIEEAERRLNNAFIYRYWFDVKTFGQFSAHFNDLTEQPKDKFSGIRDWLVEKEQEVQNGQEGL